MLGLVYKLSEVLCDRQKMVTLTDIAGRQIRGFLCNVWPIEGQNVADVQVDDRTYRINVNPSK